MKASGVLCFLSLLLAVAFPAQAANESADAAGEGAITVLSGSFGTLNSAHSLDVADALRALCAGADEQCDVPCSETTFGRFQLGKRPICRVIWRCPDGNVHSGEAAREDTILMRCLLASSQRVEPAVDELMPPRYAPPSY
ncbi:hypothetical protein [Novosphingobium sp. MMS21-SN21R]|uniref:hypothetical protein n=1 Tax=Novosphingobium sp. MMS21-SN21R TaxID=2969298 RepID=UPI002883D2A5|nr:hypothetical protein [Novosphingobium sp. MMS21-SN21R]MDT0507340.1 hypothetical protein [Novosphingobium sp. MMS21-SN21R]